MMTNTFSALIDAKRATHVERTSPLFWRNILTTNFAPIHAAILNMDRVVRSKFGSNCGVESSITSPDEHSATVHVEVMTPRATHTVYLHIGAKWLNAQAGPSATPDNSSALVEWLEDHVAGLFKNYKPMN